MVPTLIIVIVYGNINHTNLPFELPNDKQQMTCPSGQNTQAVFMSNTDAHRLLLKALLGLSDHVTLVLSGSVSSAQTGLCSLQLGTLLMNSLTRKHHTQRCAVCDVCEDMCIIATADSEPLFLRSRPRRSKMLKTSSELEERRNITESPLCHYFIPSIQTAFGVTRACSWQNALRF